MTIHSYGGSIEIPEPLIQVNTVNTWVSPTGGSWGGYQEYTTTISVGDVVLLERTADDEHDDYGRVSESAHHEETIRIFANRLKEVLGL